MSMREPDYILRLIQMGGQMVRRALDKLREGGDADEALELLDAAVQRLANTSPALLARLTPAGLVTFLGGGGSVDPLVAVALAEALEAKAEAAEVLGQHRSATLQRSQAAALRAAADKAR